MEYFLESFYFLAFWALALDFHSVLAITLPAHHNVCYFTSKEFTTSAGAFSLTSSVGSTDISSLSEASSTSSRVSSARPSSSQPTLQVSETSPTLILPSVLPTSSASPSYIFNSQSSENVAGYYGQRLTSNTTLATQCADPNI